MLYHPKQLLKISFEDYNHWHKWEILENF